MRHNWPSEAAPGYLGEVRAASAAGGGSALPTSLDETAYVPVPKKTRYISLQPQGLSTAVVVQFLLNPRCSVLKTVDDGVTYIDYSDAAQDGDGATHVVLSSLDELAEGDYVLVGSPVPIAGLYADVDAANGTTSDLAVDYWNGREWVDISPTDGSASGGATMAVDGAITWAVPGDWKKQIINGRDLYWVRLSVSAALDSSTTLDALTPINRSTKYAELVAGSPPLWMVAEGIGTVQALLDAGTGKLVVNAAAGEGHIFD